MHPASPALTPERPVVTLARYYDPSTGQFLTIDPMVAVTGQPYSYAGDSPVNNADPTGLFCWPPWSSSCNVPIADQFVSSDLGQFLNGWANGATFGGASAIDNLTPKGAANVAADQCTRLYQGAEWAGRLTTVALTLGSLAAASGGLDVVPGAASKIASLTSRYGEGIEDQVLANGTRYVDTANSGNINVFMPRPDGSGFIRVTLDPTGQRIISAGLNTEGKVTNGIANGRFVPLP